MTQTDPSGPLAGRNRSARSRARITLRTLRTDRWWVQPAITAGVLFASSSTPPGAPSRTRTTTPRPTSRRSTPPASPRTAHQDRTTSAAFVGDWYPLSPALLILVFPLGFRMTCYYYRKAYYRSFWLSPPACAVAEPHRAVHRRDPGPADPAELAPLVLLRRAGLQRDPHLRRHPGLPQLRR